jgi:DNA-binding CsgD family transcriptional regulator
LCQFRNLRRSFAQDRFVDLWQLTATADAPFGFPLQQFEEAFRRTNARAEDFFTEVRQQRFEMPHRIRILRDDGVTIHATVNCVLSNAVGSEAAEITGWLIRFHVQSQLSSIEVLLDEVYKAQKKLEVLSNREREILDLVYEGRTNKAISIVTRISEKTVEKHRARISMKLGLTSSTMMIRVITIARMLPERIPSSARETADMHQLMAGLQSSTSVRMKPPAA